MQRNRERWVRFLASIAVVAGLSPAAWGAPIAMPEGSTVWMKAEANTCPDADGDDCVGSNLLGVAPPNGIPLSTFGTGSNTATFYAEILPDQVRTYVSGASAAFMSASFVDTYSVHGSAGGTFPITVTLGAEGSASSWANSPTVNQLIGASIQLEIGTWNPGSYVSGIPVGEQFRVTAFGASSNAVVSFATMSQSTPFELPFALSATHTMTVGVGDTFDLAHGIRSALSRGTIDMMDTATISFDLPAGVWLTSALGGTWGAIPEPSTVALVALGLGSFASRSRERR